MAKQHILIVDDDQKSLRVLEISLKKAGFSVTTAANGIDALEKVAVSVPELIISDVKMPKMNGYQFCQRVKDDPKLSMIPFIFLTSQRSVEDKVRGLELGVDDYLTKPIYIRELIARVRLLLQKKEKESLEKVDQQNMFQGSLSDLGVVDLLQTIEIGRKTGQILLTSGPRSGVMYVQNGRIIDASCGNLTGPRAVYRLLTWNDGTFKIDFKPVDRAETIELSTQGLIMEGMRRLDEFERLAEQLPPLDSVLILDPQELLDQYPEGFPSRAGEIIQLFNGKRTILDVADVCGLDDLPALNIISKFYFQGLLKELEQESSNTMVQPDGSITMRGPNPAETMAKVVPDGPGDPPSDPQAEAPPGKGKPGIESASSEGIEIEIEEPELVQTPPLKPGEKTQPPYPMPAPVPAPPAVVSRPPAPPSSREVPREAESPLSQSRINEMFDEVSAVESDVGDEDLEFEAPETTQPRSRHLRAVPAPAAADVIAAKPAAPAKSQPPSPAKSRPAASLPPPVTPPPPASAPVEPVVATAKATTKAGPAAEETDDSGEVTLDGDGGIAHKPVIVAVTVSVVVTLLVVAGAGTFIWTGYLKPMLDRVSGVHRPVDSAAGTGSAVDTESLDQLLRTYAPPDLRAVIQQIDRAGAAADSEAGLRHALATARLGFLLDDNRMVTQGVLGFERLMKAARESAEGRIVLAELEVYRERNEVARQLAATLESDPSIEARGRDRASIIRGFALGRLGQLEAAAQAIGPLANRAPDEIMAPFVLAWLYDRSGDDLRAGTWAAQIVRVNPQHSPARLILARSKRKAQDTSGAQAELALAEQSDPSDPRAAVERADLQVKVIRDYETAFLEIEKLLTRDGVRDNTVIQAWLQALKAMVLLERGDLPAARIAYEQARSLDRTRPELEEIARRLSGLAQQTAGAPVATVSKATEPADAKPDYAALGRAALRKNQFRKATDLLAKACAENQKDGKLWFDFGVAAIQADDSGKALTAFANAAMLDDRNAEAHYYLGQLYSSARKNRQAIQSYERFLKLAPNHPNAPLAQAILRKLKD